jgi:hypothetical protein
VAAAATAPEGGAVAPGATDPPPAPDNAAPPTVAEDVPIITPISPDRAPPPVVAPARCGLVITSLRRTRAGRLIVEGRGGRHAVTVVFRVAGRRRRSTVIASKSGRFRASLVPPRTRASRVWVSVTAPGCVTAFRTLRVHRR